MRPGQQKRMRGRNRGKGQFNANRAYESNGPDVKVRGTAAHIAEKYVQLARDAQSSGDPILAESYLQHAEHYFRIVAASQPQFQPDGAEDEDDGDEGSEFEGPVPGFAPAPQPYPQGAGQSGEGEGQPRFQPRPYEERGEGGERPYQDRPDRFQGQERFRDRNRYQGQDRFQDRDRFQGQERFGDRDRFANERPRGERGPDRPFEPQQGEGGDRGDRFGRQGRDRNRDRRFEPRGPGGERPPYGERGPFERPPYGGERDRPPIPRERDRPPPVGLDQPQPDIEDAALSTLPSFITAPAAAPAPVPSEPEAGEAAAPTRRRRGPRRPSEPTATPETASD